MRERTKSAISLFTVIALCAQGISVFPTLLRAADETQAGEIFPGVIEVDAGKIYTPPQGQSDSLTEPVEARVTKVDVQAQAPGIESNGTNPVDRGLAWLSQNQAVDGSWSTANAVRLADTLAVTELLRKLDGRIGASSTEQGMIDAAYPRAKDWLRSAFPENTYDLASKIMLLGSMGDDMNAAAEYLTAQINENDFGFGFRKEYAGEMVATAEALRAITATNYVDPGSDPQFTLKATLLYLLGRQNTDGGWPEIFGGQSSLFATNVVMQALLPYRDVILVGAPSGDIVIAERAARGISYLKSYQWTFDGSWQGNLLWSALSYDTFVNYLAVPVENERAIAYLAGQQNADGSFGSSGAPFISAKAVQALAKADMALSNLENLYSAPSSTAGVRATVSNNGYLTSLPFNLSAAPAAFHFFIDGQEVPLDVSGLPASFAFEPGAFALFDIEFSAPIFGQHDVKFSLDYPDAELRKSNNELARKIEFNAPQFSGPTAPSWTGASTSPTPGEVRLRWQLSPDPNVEHYEIYITDVSGAYNHASPSIVLPPGNIVGVSLSINSSFYEVPLYYSVVAVDPGRGRGNYSPETWAIAYPNPEGVRGTISGRVFEEQSGENIPNAAIDLYFLTSFSADQNGNYSISFYPGFYLATASTPNHYGITTPIQIAAGSATTADLPAVDFTASPPPQITGLTVTPGDRQITLTWDSYLPAPPNFAWFRVYRELASFSVGPNFTPIDLTLTDPAATSFTDTTVVNGTNYYYAVVPENSFGLYPGASSLGPFRANSAPRVENVQAHQSGPRADLAYDLADDENVSLFVRFQYWDGSAWQEAVTTVGEGMQAPGTLKVGAWDAKQDLPGFEGDMKVKILASDGQAVNASGFSESPPFFLDTRNPAAPAIDPYQSVVSQPSYQLSGTKEVNAALLLNGVAVVPLGPETAWTYLATLQGGVNILTFTAKDAAGNESGGTQALITYDASTPPPDDGGAPIGGKDIQLRPAEGGSQ